MDINTNGHNITKYSIKLLHKNTKLFTKEFLKSRNMPDIISISFYSEGYINKSNSLTKKLEHHVYISALTF